MLEVLGTKCVIPKSVEWVSPTRMILKLDDDKDSIADCKLLKGALDYVHKMIGLKVATSKEVYKKSQETWKELIQIQLNEVNNVMDETQKFYLGKPTMVYLLDSDYNIVDIRDFRTLNAVEEFKEKHQIYTLEMTTITRTRKFFNDNETTGLVKLVCYDADADIVENSFTPVIIFELNNKKSKYSVYTGILIYDCFTFFPTPSVVTSDESLIDFINDFEIDRYIEYSNENSNALYENYQASVDNSVEISARELTSLCRKVGYKLELESDVKLHPIENMSDEENNIRIQQFYNTFSAITGETTYEILKLSELRKTFRYNKLTLLEVLGIMSKEYLTTSGSKVVADILCDISYKLMNSLDNDKSQIEDVKRDVEVS